MSFLLKETIHQSLSSTLYNEVFSGRSTYHYFIGRILDWDTPSTPDTPESTGTYEYETRNHIIATKKIKANDCSLVIRRIDWQSGEVYDQYDPDYSVDMPADSGATSLKDANFYVLTADFNVYKCIFNNNGAESTEEPIGTDAIVIEYNDGYIWKYMYTIPLSSRNKFLTDSYMPVQTSVNSSFYSDGQIDSIVIDSRGSGYTSANTTIIVEGDGLNANLTPVINLSGELEDIIIQNRGNGYTYANITVDGDGTGANASVVLSTNDINSVQSTVELAAVDGAIHALRVDNVGLGYNTSATITVVGDGTGFVGNVIRDNNTISRIEVSNPGSGYTHATATISSTYGANANITPIISPYNGHGRNAVKELFAEAVMFYSTINNDKINSVTVNNDYRQFGIIKDIENYDSSTKFGNLIGSPCFVVTVNDKGSLVDDMIIELQSDDTKKFEVVESSYGTNKLLISNLNNYDVVEGTIFSDPSSGETYIVESIDASPTINKFSGDLLFIDNRTAARYNEQQIVTLRTVIKL